MEKGPTINVSKLASGDTKTFQILFERAYRPLVRWSAFYVHDIAAAEDIAQDAFAKLWSNRRSLGGVRDVEGYLKTLVRNSSINYLEHQAVKERFGRINPPEKAHEDDIDGFLDTLTVLLASLPEKRREVLRMNICEGRSYAQIAQQLGISLNTVKDHIKKAYAFLRENAGQERI